VIRIPLIQKKHLQSDVSRMQKTLEVISKKIGCQLDMCTLVDDQFTSDDIQTWLEGLPKVSNDIVFFYYTGHGSKDGLAKPWPVLCVWNKMSPYKALGGSAVVNYLKQSKHRLTIILFDCCNGTYVDKNHFTHIPKGHEVMMQDTMTLPGLETLFLQTKGFIVGAAAAPREKSLCQLGVPAGSVFSIELIKALIHYCSKEYSSWKKILAKTYQNSVKETEDDKGGPQHAIFRYELKTS